MGTPQYYSKAGGITMTVIGATILGFGSWLIWFVIALGLILLAIGIPLLCVGIHKIRKVSRLNNNLAAQYAQQQTPYPEYLPSGYGASPYDSPPAYPQQPMPFAPAPGMNADAEPENIRQIKQYKELLDKGIITQEEFDAKKRLLLGL